MISYAKPDYVYIVLPDCKTFIDNAFFRETAVDDFVEGRKTFVAIKQLQLP